MSEMMGRVRRSKRRENGGDLNGAVVVVVGEGAALVYGHGERGLPSGRKHAGSPRVVVDVHERLSESLAAVLDQRRSDVVGPRRCARIDILQRRCDIIHAEDIEGGIGERTVAQMLCVLGNLLIDERRRDRGGGGVCVVGEGVVGDELTEGVKCTAKVGGERVVAMTKRGRHATLMTRVATEDVPKLLAVLGGGEGLAHLVLPLLSQARDGVGQPLALSLGDQEGRERRKRHDGQQRKQPHHACNQATDQGEERGRACRTSGCEE